MKLQREEDKLGSRPPCLANGKEKSTKRAPRPIPTELLPGGKMTRCEIYLGCYRKIEAESSQTEGPKMKAEALGYAPKGSRTTYAMKTKRVYIKIKNEDLG